MLKNTRYFKEPNRKFELKVTEVDFTREVTRLEWAEEFVNLKTDQLNLT